MHTPQKFANMRTAETEGKLLSYTNWSNYCTHTLLLLLIHSSSKKKEWGCLFSTKKKKKKYWQIHWSKSFPAYKTLYTGNFVSSLQAEIHTGYNFKLLNSNFPLMSLVIETSIMSISLCRYSLVYKTFLPPFSRMAGYRYNLVKILSCEKSTSVKTILIV